MSHACTPILVGVTSPVLKILLLPKTDNFPFRTMGYSPDRLLKKFMQIGMDVTCMQHFGGRDLSGFGDNSQKRPIFPFGPWAIVHGHQKI